LSAELQGIQCRLKERPARTVHPWQGVAITGGIRCSVPRWQLRKAGSYERLAGAKE